MSFSTTFSPREVLVLSADDTIVWGTVMLGTTYGEVVSCSVGREWNTEEITNGVGGLAAYIWRMPRFVMSLETRMDSDITAPGAGDRILFPLPAVWGRVISATVNWESGGVRSLSIEATFYDELSGAPLNKWTGTAYTQIDDGSAPS